MIRVLWQNSGKMMVYDANTKVLLILTTAHVQKHGNAIFIAGITVRTVAVLC